MDAWKPDATAAAVAAAAWTPDDTTGSATAAATATVTTPITAIVILPFLSPSWQHLVVRRVLPGKDLDNAIAAATDDPFAVRAPHDGADALAPHNAVARDLLRAGPLLKAPETQGRIVTGADQLLTVGAERQARDGRRVSEHVVGALTAVGIEKTDKAVLVPRDDDAFDPGSCHGPPSTSGTARVGLVFAAAGLRLIQPHGGGDDGVDTRAERAVVRLEASHAADLFTRARVVHDDGRIRVADHKGLARAAKCCDAGWACISTVPVGARDGVHEGVAKSAVGGHRGLRGGRERRAGAHGVAPNSPTAAPTAAARERRLRR